MENEPPLPGIRYLRLNIDDAKARTLMPVALGTIDPANYYYRLKHTNGTQDQDLEGVYNGTSIGLVAGNEYSLIVEGRTTAGVVVATGEYADTIEADDLPVGAITINMFLVDNDGTGTFTYNFDFSAIGIDLEATPNPDTASLTFTPLSAWAQHTSNNANITTINFTDNTSTDTRVLNSGYYLITLTVSEFAGNSFDIIIVETVHIYQGQFTPWVGTLPALVSKKFNVTYNVNGGSPWGVLSPTNPSITDNSVEHYSTLTAPAEPVHTNADYDFYDWYTQVNAVGEITSFTNGVRWRFAPGANPSRVFGNLNLYAAYEDNTPAALSLNFNTTTYATPGEVLGNLGAISNITSDQLNGGGTNLIRTFIIPGGFTAGLENFELRVDGVAVPGAAFDITQGAGPNVNDLVLTIDFLANIAVYNPILTTTARPLTVIAEIDDGTDVTYWGGQINVSITIP